VSLATYPPPVLTNQLLTGIAVLLVIVVFCLVVIIVFLGYILDALRKKPPRS